MGEGNDGPAIPLRLAEGLRDRVRTVVVHAAPVLVEASRAPLIEEMDGLAESLRGRFAGRRPSEIDELRPARELYRAFGVDPTKTRPSSEALLRRVLRGGTLPRILNAVDLANLLALRFLLPIGLYDAAKIVPPVELREGRDGESYAGIRKAAVHLHGRPVLSDRHGPFGNPTSDSARTAIGPTARALWLVVFAPAATPAPALVDHLRIAREAMERHLAPHGARAVASGRLFPGAD